MAVQNAVCQHEAVDGTIIAAKDTVELPYAVPAEEKSARSAMSCTFKLDLSKNEIRNSALLIPFFVDSLKLKVNGQHVMNADMYTMRLLRFASVPAFLPLPGDVLRVGQNRFLIEVAARPARAAALDKIFFGGENKLRPYYHARWFVTVALPTLAVGGKVALAVMFALIWSARPKESAFGWLAIVLALGALRGSVLIPDFRMGITERFYWDMAIPWEALAVFMFCRALVPTSGSRWSWLLVVPPIALLPLYVLMPGHDIVIYGGMAVMFCYFSMAIWVLVKGALHRNRDAQIVVLGLSVLLIFIIHDIVVVIYSDPGGILLTRTTFSSFFIVIVTLMTFRFVQAVEIADNAANTLRERIADTETELRATYEELRIHREAEAVERERARLMRDLHDGLGGELVSVLALADGPNPSTSEIANHARAALADMRLIIGSLEDYGGDLALALGAWRERAEPQVRSAGLSLTWSVRDLPRIEGLGSAQVLDILRIVQEAVTNVIRHASASRISIETFEADDHIGIAVRDDGKGFSGQPDCNGNGIQNMRTRASRLNGSLTINGDKEQTSVLLVLPRTLSPYFLASH